MSPSGGGPRLSPRPATGSYTVRNMPALRSARAVNSGQLAVDLIREAILDGELVAGERLKEDDLARRLDVSRTPVREALRRLQAEGLVVVEPQRGATVRAYETRELEDRYSRRAG